MKNFSIKSYVAGILTMAILLSSTLVFAETKQTIEAIFGRVKLVVDGKLVDKETLVYNGTTYVPLRAAAEVLGMEVGWDGETNTASLTSETAVQAQNTPSPQTTKPAPSNNVTTGQKNALNSALQYLDFMAFSYSGLIEQLKYEKYSHEQAVYAADNCGANWNEQAAECAKSYLEYSSFSREGLIDQLAYEGFTPEQAVYGVNAVGL